MPQFVCKRERKRILDDAILTMPERLKDFGKSLSEVICHNNFPRLMADIDIFPGHIASMQIEHLNHGIGTARSIVQKQYRPDGNELYYRTAELEKVPADEYAGSILRDDLAGSLRDIHKARPKKMRTYCRLL